jgi:hypothetical protein
VTVVMQSVNILNVMEPKKKDLSPIQGCSVDPIKIIALFENVFWQNAAKVRKHFVFVNDDS